VLRENLSAGLPAGFTGKIILLEEGCHDGLCYKENIPVVVPANSAGRSHRNIFPICLSI
jgi:hypothetical protein